ncbi:pentatricopeptide repeat-containing protein At4g18975, chloroplastic [Mercurialis annua]|uniref:pentatricopeptide repeat-containing protein At4g18975, chloroplastic n=1 Tax=Mercurialis annua TaxID=3986 RepID=UPI00215E241F|nr:pentatricopeptide repeat-containing protein At4g18975, chloroplastic [Mercurialis annua]XP_050228381.1 pentatricopeptide repeat-containing protein At4g18975, chloroplastic [Mercurialis annua]XP_050228383.1 pentatricopeptide repeat-containing protein At4g18975, chloroplastic [Mercurialis annua]XP_050228384.1 pentatricopeptide repeat-containing protein At4g18975, chloroplastic [Mercurialis annua]
MALQTTSMLYSTTSKAPGWVVGNMKLIGLYCKSKKLSRRFGVSSSNLSTAHNSLSPQPKVAKYSANQSRQSKSNSAADNRKPVKKAANTEKHLWKKRDSARSGQKALTLVRIVCELPDEKDAVYGALDKWTAWETEFPLIAVAKALRILRKHRQWKRVIQVAKWMLSKGQGTTMGTYDLLLLAFDMDSRVDEAASLWNMILHTHARSISKWLFSRMISLYDHHHMPEEVIEIFADMEELGVRPDEDTVKRVAGAFKELGQEGKQKLFLKKYMHRWKYIHFNGERVRVRRNIPDERNLG